MAEFRSYEVPLQERSGILLVAIHDRIGAHVGERLDRERRIEAAHRREGRAANDEEVWDVPAQFLVERGFVRPARDQNEGCEHIHLAPLIRMIMLEDFWRRRQLRRPESMSPGRGPFLSLGADAVQPFTHSLVV